MSSRASDGIPLNLPDRLLADRAADALAILAVSVAGVVVAAHLSAAWGGLFALGMSLVALRLRRRVKGGPFEIDPRAAVRRFGPTLVVRVRAATGRPRTLWLTPADVPATDLRRACLRLRAGRAEVGS